MTINADNQNDQRTASPCVRNCCLDEADVCMGCGRHISEILVWHQATNSEREKIIVLANDRLQRRALRHRDPGP
ncbi:MAG TPA: DUF1289 domain-containing protein [Arenimonas sp.]|nr:DUF1289 domain-containing protein [Arenimonas sp.]HPO23108.1 DUF1289 domain-containing protein [Arenimonas sp.]